MKRSFLLLEVLLAITVVAVFAAPLMRWPIKHYQSQIDRLEEFEYQRIADWTFSEIKELLLKEGIAWSKLPTKGGTLARPLSDVKRHIPQFPDRTVRRSFILKCRGEKKGPHGEIFRIYQVEITMDSKKSYQYRILVQRLA
jgi:3'-phosphoadenosine 5'-phosphosulfate sulfotransferase (PAPS reductase)/FAD synthetase